MMQFPLWPIRMPLVIAIQTESSPEQISLDNNIEAVQE